MRKILVVEDNEANMALITRFLRRGGYAVICAGDGAHGVALAQSESPDLILMDLNLPGMDGWEATRHLKASPPTRGIPVIALTAHAFDADVQRALDAGCDAFETKPVAYERLLLKVRSMIEAGV